MIYENKDYEIFRDSFVDGVSCEIVDLAQKIDDFYKKLDKDLTDIRYAPRYFRTIESILNTFPIKTQKVNETYEYRINGKMGLHISAPELEKALTDYIAKFESIEYLEFLREENRNVVFVGPNGCGKTTLLRKLQKDTREAKIHFYTADRILIVDDDFTPRASYVPFKRELDESFKGSSDVDSGRQKYDSPKQLSFFLHLLEVERADENERREYNGKTQRILNEWHELVKDRELYFDHGCLCVRTMAGNGYDLKYLSSGEKSILYFLTGILLQDKQDFYFIDEPENNLNPAIVSKLWDFIETNCPNSIFVYLTHNSDFVASRINAKNYWIEKYDGSNWKWRKLPENTNLPQELLIKLVGSREPIIFCESQNEYKYDSIVYKLMFPEFKIESCNGCDKVKARVKAYKETGLPQKVYGIIDCDYNSDTELEAMKNKNIFHIPFHEIENFLLSEEILELVIEEFSRKNKQQDLLNQIKERVRQIFIKQKEQWIAKHVAFSIRNKFNYADSIKSLHNMDELRTAYGKSHVSDEEFEEKAMCYENKFDEILKRNEYDTFLRYLDQKGLMTILAPVLKLRDEMNYATAVLIALKTDKGKQLLQKLRVMYFSEIVT